MRATDAKSAEALENRSIRTTGSTIRREEEREIDQMINKNVAAWGCAQRTADCWKWTVGRVQWRNLQSQISQGKEKKSKFIHFSIQEGVAIQMRNGGSDCAGIITSFVSRGYFLILRLFFCF